MQAMVPPTVDNSAALNHYRRAAAVRSTFTSETLPPLAGGRHDNIAIMDVLSEAERVRNDAGEWAWRLKNNVRRQLLQEMSANDVRAAVAEVPVEGDVLQRMLHSYASAPTDGVPPLEAQTVAELIATLQVRDWLDGILPALPPRQAVIDRLEYEQLLEPFRQLVGEHFQGRKEQLAYLHDFVWSGGPVRSIYADEGRPLVINGPGGVGKSTLVAKFVLDNLVTESGVPAPLAFCYWDFDRVVLQAEEPVTLLAELALQLGSQFPGIKAEATEMRERWLNELERSSAAPVSKGSSPDREMRQQGSRRKGLGKEVWDLRTLAESLRSSVGTVRLVLVLDTFERVQELSFDYTAALWETLNEVQAAFLTMRTLVVGRAELDARIAHIPYLLDALDEEAAQGYLLSRGIPNIQVAEEIYRFVGGDPLSLHLAIDGLRQDYPDLSKLTTLPSDFGDLRLDHEYNQGWLYRRYLLKIADPPVQRLAHPGLVLRRVTPGLIRHVLAVPCEVEVPDDETAQALFDRLAAQASLVIREDAQTLKHRGDVRKRMLLGLRQTEGGKAYEIHRDAVAYYEKRPENPPQRAEEIYHRLWLDQSRDEIDKRWIPGLRTHLIDALDELPSKARAILAGKFGSTAAKIDWDEADAKSKEELLAARARDALALDRPLDAVQLLAPVKERLAGSPLYLLEAQALERLGRWPEARIVANEGVFSAKQAHDARLELDLLLTGVAANEVLGSYDAALRLLRAAEQAWAAVEWGHEDDKQLNKLELLMHRLRLLRLDPRGDETNHEQLQAEAAEILEDLWSTVQKQHPLLLYDAVEELAVMHPALLARLLSETREGLSDPQRAQLMSAILQIEKGRGKAQAGLTVITPEHIDEIGRGPLTQGFVSALITVMRSSITARQQGGLTTDIIDRLSAALYEAFPERRDLFAFLAETEKAFPQVRPQPDSNTTYTETLGGLARAFEEAGLTEALVQRALTVRPDAPKLRELAAYLHDLGQGGPIAKGLEPGPEAGLESVTPDQVNLYVPLVALPPFPATDDQHEDVTAPPAFVQAWAAGASAAMRAVCRVDLRESKATGFLVAPDLVLTFLGRVSDDTAGDECHFIFDNYHGPDGVIGGGTTYRAARDWRAWVMPEAGVYLLRVDGTPGADLVPGTQEIRGTLKLAPEVPPLGRRLSILHHALGGPMLLELARTGASADGSGQTMISGFSERRMPGRAGAPYLDEKWEVVAVHVGTSGPEQAELLRNVVWARDLLADKSFLNTLGRYSNV